MKNEFEYYLLLAMAIPNSPAVIVGENPTREDLMINHPLNNIDVVEFTLDEPYPTKPVMVDFHDDGIIDVFSEKVCQILFPLNIKGIQLVPAVISNPKNKDIYDHYYYLHIYNHINCLDTQNSDCTVSRAGTVRLIRKMVLDITVLAKISLEERLIFRLGELYTHQLFHKSIVDKIMESKPSGIRFVKVEDYHLGSAFD
jgi:hypothetical protein